MLQKIDGGTKVRQASNVLASNVEEMKEFLKAALDRLETTDLKEEGAGGKKRREETLSSSPKAAMSQQIVESNAACTLTKDKQPAIATPCTVAMDVDAAEELSITKANAEVKVNKRTPKKKRKESKKRPQKP